MDVSFAADKEKVFLPPGNPVESPSLINPSREPGEPPVAPRVVLAFARPDYHNLCRLSGSTGPPRYLWDCAVHEGAWQGKGITVAGPVLGAPYAVMVTERLITLGAKVILALGWCGSLQEQVKVGSLVLPTAAVSGDGTSRHYLARGSQPTPHPDLIRLLQEHLQDPDILCHCGLVWTTDAFYRETPEQVRHYQAQGVLGVDLEIAALFAVGQYRQVAVAGLLAVSDELGDLTWRPGFKTPAFKQGRRQATQAVLNAAAAADL